MANSVDPDPTAPIGAVCSGSTLFASILNSRRFFAAENFSRRHFQMRFFLAILRVNTFLASEDWFADNLSKQFGARVGPTFCRA